MYLISRKLITVSFFLIILSTVTLAYLSIDIRDGASDHLSIISQNILYWAIIAVIIQIGVFVFIYGSNKKVLRDIRTVSNIGELSHPKVKKTLSSMGGLGKEIELLLKKQNEIVELRAGRITALNNLIAKIIQDCKSSFIITDSAGNILYKVNISPETEGLFPGLPIETVVSFMETNRVNWSDDNYKGITAIPVFDRDIKLTYSIWEFGSESKPRREVIKVKTGKMKEFFKAFKKKNSPGSSS